MDEEFWQETGKRLELVCLVANLSLQPPQHSAEFERTWCAIPETASGNTVPTASYRGFQVG